ncbi:MAG: cell division protein FtsA [Prevotellaceae bacterium]|jgi:cell division protein FtsA|nr:cell division protein FtsA [Prevotellaceae bacterium]
MPKYVVAIDLGTTKVVSLVGEKTENENYKIVAYSEAPSDGIRRGQVEHISKVVNAVIPTLTQIKAEAGITNLENIYVGIAGQHITCIENRVEKIRDQYDSMITKEEIAELEVNAGRMHLSPDTEILHVIPQYYSIDNRNGITDPIGRLGNKLTGHYYVVIGNMANRIHTNTCMRELNLSMNKLILEPIASARATLSDDEKEMGVAMIDIGGGTTDLIVYKDNTIIHTAVIPFGGNSISEDIKNICSVMFNQAEQIKIQFGLTANTEGSVRVEGINGRPSRDIPLDIITKIITSRLNEIIDMVMYEIINKTQCGKLGAGLVITGGVSKMSGLRDFLLQRLKDLAGKEPAIQKRMNIEVVIGNPNNIVDSDVSVIHPKYSTAVGLIMCGFDHLDSFTPKQTPPPPLQPPPPPPLPPKRLPEWVQKLSKAFVMFMNPQQEEKND